MGSTLILHSYNLLLVNLLFLSIFGINQPDPEHYLIHGTLETVPPQLFKIHPPLITQQEHTLLNSLYKATSVVAVQPLKTLWLQVKRLTLHLLQAFALAKQSTFKITRFLHLFRRFGRLATVQRLLKSTR